MRRLAIMLSVGLLCTAKSNLSRQAQQLTTSVSVGDLFNIVRDGGSAAELIAALLQGADADAVDDKGMSLLHHAAQLGRDDMVAVLRGHGAEVERRDNAGRTALQLAQEKQHTKVVDLLRGRAEKDKDDAAGCDNALHVAALAKDKAAVERLLSAGAEVNAVDDIGRTALHYAALQGDMEIVNMLLAHGAQLGVQDNFGNTPAQAAQFAQQPHIVTVLEQQQVHDAHEEMLMRRALDLRKKNKTCPRSWQQ